MDDKSWSVMHSFFFAFACLYGQSTSGDECCHILQLVPAAIEHGPKLDVFSLAPFAEGDIFVGCGPFSAAMGHLLASWQLFS